jgi:hypothetical protein
VSGWAVVRDATPGRCCRLVASGANTARRPPPRQCSWHGVHRIDGLALCGRHYDEYLKREMVKT